MKMKSLFTALVLLTVAFCSNAAEPLVNSGQRVVFLGDSNTYASHYVNLVEATLLAAGKADGIEILNLGLSSETASGLSEPDHPFPRPCVHERLSRVLAKTKPDVVVACYGMNDGMYYPQSDDRMAAYRSGITRLIEKVNKSGAKLVLMTPPPFDPLPQRKKGKLLPRNAEKFAWFSIYEDYDSVLADYSKWLLALDDKRVEQVIDIRTPMEEYIAKKRLANPDYVMSGDGVHFNTEGHKIIGKKVLSALGFDVPTEVDASLLKLVSQRQVILRDAWLTYCGHKRPKTRAGLPMPEAKKKADALWAQIETKLK